MEKYNAQENIKHLTEWLDEKLDPTKREIIIRFISLERAKLSGILKSEEIRSKKTGFMNWYWHIITPRRIQDLYPSSNPSVITLAARLNSDSIAQ